MQKKYDIGMRIWHWLNTIVMFGVIITVFLRETFLNKHHIADIIINKLQHLNLTIQPENAIMIAKAIREPMWQWHIYLGFGIFALWIMRMFLFQTLSGRINYMHFKEENFHKKMVKLGYIAIYAAIFYNY
jgi:cytochrome b561